MVSVDSKAWEADESMFGMAICECGSKSFHIVVERSPERPKINNEEYYCAECGQIVELPYITEGEE